MALGLKGSHWDREGGWTEPLEVCSMAGGRDGGRAGREGLVSTCPQCSSWIAESPGAGSGELSGLPGLDTCCVQPPKDLINCPRYYCVYHRVPERLCRERQRAFNAEKPWHPPSSGTAPGQDPQGLTTGQMGEEIGRDCLCSVQLSSKQKLKELDPDPSGAWSPCMCACRSPGHSARRQSLWLLKMLGWHHNNPPKCPHVPRNCLLLPSSQGSRCPKEGNLLCKRFWYLPMNLQVSFHLCLITEAEATYLLPYSAMDSSFPWPSPLRLLEKPLFPVASRSRFTSKQCFRPCCQDPFLSSPAHPWTALLKGGLCWLVCSWLSTLPSPFQNQMEPDRGCSRKSLCRTHRFLHLDRWEQAVGERRKKFSEGKPAGLYTTVVHPMQIHLVLGWVFTPNLSIPVMKNQFPVHKGLAISSPTMKVWEWVMAHE